MHLPGRLSAGTASYLHTHRMKGPTRLRFHRLDLNLQVVVILPSSNVALGCANTEITKWAPHPVPITRPVLRGRVPQNPLIQIPQLKPTRHKPKPRQLLRARRLTRPHRFAHDVLHPQQHLMPKCTGDTPVLPKWVRGQGKRWPWWHEARRGPWLKRVSFIRLPSQLRT